VSIIEPEGMVKAWMMRVRITSASRMAMAIASAYSRTTDLRRRALVTGSAVTSFVLWTSLSRTSISS